MMNINDLVKEKESVQRKKIKDLALFSEYVPSFEEDEFSRTDGKLVNISNLKKYVFESKWYGNPKYPRNSNAYKDYQIDYDKLVELENKAKENNSTPLLICFFSNELVIWDINKCDWKPTKKWVCTNAYGVNYGAKKEYSYQAYLNLSDAIYRNTSITPFN